MAVVGESGSGKTTLGRCAVRLIEPTAGRVVFAGEDLAALGRRELRARRRRFQMVFQDPYGSLDPRQRVDSILAEPLAIHTRLDRAGRAARVAGLLEEVGLKPELAGRYPNELSGGQRQAVWASPGRWRRSRSCWWRTSRCRPSTFRVRGQVLALLSELRRRLGLTLLFIAHDMAAVEQLADRVAVMYLGRVVELGGVRGAAAAASPSVHGEPALGRAGARARPAAAPHRARRGAAEPAGAALRLPVSPALPQRPAALLRRDAAARGTGRNYRGRGKPRLVACFYPGGDPGERCKE